MAQALHSQPFSSNVNGEVSVLCGYALNTILILLDPSSVDMGPSAEPWREEDSVENQQQHFVLCQSSPTCVITAIPSTGMGFVHWLFVCLFFSSR